MAGIGNVCIGKEDVEDAELAIPAVLVPPAFELFAPAFSNSAASALRRCATYSGGVLVSFQAPDPYHNEWIRFDLRAAINWHLQGEMSTENDLLD